MLITLFVTLVTPDIIGVIIKLLSHWLKTIINSQTET